MHANAAGVAIDTNNVDALLAQANKDFANADFGNTTFFVDYVFTQENAEDAYYVVSELGSEKFWGRGVEIPLIAFEQIELTKEEVQLMKNNSMKFTIGGVECVTFRNEKACQDFSEHERFFVDVVGKPGVNEWLGRITPQIIISDYNITKAPTHVFW